MKKWLKVLLWSFFGLIVLIGFMMGIFIYKVQYGLPFYDSKPPTLSLNQADFNVLVFSKTNGFRHAEAIEQSKITFEKMGVDNDWNVVISDNGAIFNDEQLSYMDVVIWNNTTGRNLTDDQRLSFRRYMESGGGYIGTHGSGDFSHHWPWYEQTLIGANFTHHTMNPQFQTATMQRACDSTFYGCDDLTSTWIREEEWYVFSNNPRENGANVIYTVDENTFDPNGNVRFLLTDKDFGMGDDHPIVWYNCLDGGGKSFYSALGHSGAAFEEPNHLLLLKNAIKWVGSGEPCQ
ncbi:MAG: ThuA domain-containing protein [Cyclobacteriaceae bacterium]